MPDVVHVHDWQAALTLAYMRFGRAVGVPSVITVHNLAFQGQFGASIFPDLGLPPEAMALDGVEYYGGVGYLKAGLQAAWAITTVSPTYAAGDHHAAVRHGPRRVDHHARRRPARHRQRHRHRHLEPEDATPICPPPFRPRR